MTEPTPFVDNGPHGSPLYHDGKRVGHISWGGPELVMPLADGTTMVFEMHHYFGPTPLDSKGDILDDVPGKFWDAWELWDLGGKMVIENHCVVPEKCPACKGVGAEVEMISKRTAVVGETCKVCDGKKVVWPAQE